MMNPLPPLTLAQRCEIAEDCLPQAGYRNRLNRLHVEMLGALDLALIVCQCATRVIDSSAFQRIGSDAACDLEVAVRNWRALP